MNDLVLKNSTDKNEYDDSKRIIMYSHNNSFVYFYINNNRLFDVRVEQINEFHSGDIVLCRIEKNKPDIGGYFVNLGNGQKGLLQYENIIESDIKQGDEIPVMILKEAYENKVANVSMYLEIKGKYCIISNKVINNNHINFSKKISMQKRNELKDQLEYISDYSILLRSCCNDIVTDVIISDIAKVIDRFDKLVNSAKHGMLYTILHKEYYLLNVLREYSPVKIVAADSKAYDFVRSNIDVNSIDINNKLELFSDNHLTPAIKYGLNSKLDAITKEKVYLSSGAYLFVSKTPAMTVIDVNSGGSNHSRNKEEAYLKTNLEAAEEITYQVQARNISGIVIIDFINLRSEKSRNMLINRCNELFGSIKPVLKVVDITKLGLLEATRERKQIDIYETMKKFDKNILR